MIKTNLRQPNCNFSHSRAVSLFNNRAYEHFATKIILFRNVVGLVHLRVVIVHGPQEGQSRLEGLASGGVDVRNQRLAELQTCTRMDSKDSLSPPVTETDKETQCDLAR